MKNYLLKSAVMASLAGYTLNANAAVIGTQLEARLNTLGALENTMVVVTYNQLDSVDSNQVQSLMNLGITEGVQFQSLPSIGVLANPSQINEIAAMSEVKSVFLNRELEYFNDESRKVTSVDEIQNDEFYQENGIRFTGEGVTVIVNDSGIDATLDDLAFGDKVVENVQGITHASVLSLTPFPGMWIEGQLNSDLNVGHGTHCAGTVGGTGAHSDGKYAGVATGADLIGYGSGAGLSILDALGGYDYAITHIWDFNSPIRVMSNSWGSSGQYEPDGPISVASYKAYKLGMISVFAAGNDGPGEDTHNPYAQIPWGMSVGAGTKHGTLVDFSSRGKRFESGDFSMPDGTEWTYHNEVSIVAPGQDIISTRAKTNIASNGGDADIDAIETEYLPYYTMISGTSMATPHVAGIIALMLEANPDLSPLEVKTILQETATNIPGYEKWEVGGGYVNAKAAVAGALDYNTDYAKTVNNLNEFNANALIIPPNGSEAFEVFYSPVGEPEVYEFEVDEDAAFVSASAEPLANTVKLKLEAPDGTEYLGNLTLPVLSWSTKVSAPAQVGTWKLSVFGLTSLSGVQADPTGVTNGPGVPEFISGEIEIFGNGGYEGLNDIAGHPAENAITFAVANRLVDSLNDSNFYPDRKLKRKHLAKYLVMGAAVRQQRDLLNSAMTVYSDVSSTDAAFINAVTQTGSALKDPEHQQAPIMLAKTGAFKPNDKVSREELGYSMVQSLGLESDAALFAGTDSLKVEYNGQEVPVRDSDLVSAEYLAHMQVALNLSLLNVQFAIEQGPYDLQPTLVAYLKPNEMIKRGEYAVAIGRMFENYYR
ncbi:S8 family peptidase [Marinicella litoralis]|uniref:Serine protease AprX n=1 Tax=Marinicella litoralis TaxID=644220 RepID=A0A4R6XJ72_9GAMM|nr:S8 family serine peptidase [Marinicella litoralis]TDR19542.1 serine protease AprX [Marinicella litoralis]